MATLDPFKPEHRKVLLTELAKRHLLVDETLEVRNSDSLDFHDCNVACIADALEEAFRLGQQSITRQF